MNFVERQQPKPHTSDRFGCQLTKLDVNQATNSSGIAIYRKASDEGGVGEVKTDGSSGGFLVGLSMSAGHERLIKHGNQTTGYRFGNGSIYIRDLAEDYSADLRGAFDFMLFEIPQVALNEFGENADVEGYSLSSQIAVRDPFLEKLCHAIAPVLKDPESSSPLFLELMVRAAGAHILQQYGGAKIVSENRTKRFSAQNLARATDYLESNLTGDVSIKEVAASLDMTPALFTRLFRQATGTTPYRWVVQKRVDRAAIMLKSSDLSIGEIAVACGFSDHAHFTRVFSTYMGLPPRKWRNV